MENGSSRKPYIIATLVAIAIAGSAALYKFVIEEPPTSPRTIPVVGKVGSAHAHASLLVMSKDKVADFCSPLYMLKSQYVHFENNNCTVVHRHATGVTLPTFFKTIGLTLTQDCLILPSGKYCDDGTNHLKAVVNGTEMSIDDLQYYEFKNNDHILINYGPESGTMLKFKYNQVPEIPLDVNEPLITDPFGNAVNNAAVTPLVNTKLDNP